MNFSLTPDAPRPGADEFLEALLPRPAPTFHPVTGARAPAPAPAEPNLAWLRVRNALAEDQFFVVDEYFNVIAGPAPPFDAGAVNPYAPEELFKKPERGLAAFVRRSLERVFWETFDREVRASPFLSLFSIRGCTVAEMRALRPSQRGMYLVGDTEVKVGDGRSNVMKVYGEWLERGLRDDVHSAAAQLARRMVARVGHELGYAVSRPEYKVALLGTKLRKVLVDSDEGHVIGYASEERGRHGACVQAIGVPRPAWLGKLPYLPLGPVTVAVDERGKAGEYRIMPGVNPVVSVYFRDPEHSAHAQIPPGHARVYSCHNGLAVTALDNGY